MGMSLCMPGMHAVGFTMCLLVSVHGWTVDRTEQMYVYMYVHSKSLFYIMKL